MTLGCAYIRQRGPWAVYDAPVPEPDGPPFYRWLVSNRDLPGPGRVVRSRLGLRRRGELPAPRGNGAADGWALRSLDDAKRSSGHLEAIERCAREVADSFEAAQGSETRQEPLAPEPLAARCREAGYSAQVRSGVRVLVRLPAGDRFAEAELAAGGRALLARVELCSGADALSDSAREAVALFLLEVTSRIRLVRAVAAGAQIAVEVTLSAAPERAELRDACEALALAVRATQTEVTQLCTDAELAQEYLGAAAYARAASEGSS